MSKTKQYYEKQELNKNTLQERIQKLEEKIKQLEKFILSKVQ